MISLMKRRPVFVTLVTILSVAGLFAIGMIGLSLSSRMPSNLGVRDGRLAPCPETPNCVSTQADDQLHWIAPLDVPDDVDDPLGLIAEIVRSLPGATVMESGPEYLRSEFRSSLFRFCDDVEFLIETGGRRIHFRSASRVGRSDLGVNRARMEDIRARWTDAVRRRQETGAKAANWTAPAAAWR